jgi:hypothetical protein
VAIAEADRRILRALQRRGSFHAMQKTVSKELVGHIAEVNGKRSVIGYVQGKPFSVVSINVTNGRSEDVFVVTNPEKLSRLSELKEG